ncbi:MAG TPA: DUF1844 domain-containing protein [Candidatus Acidoferrales bacterium]|nr:DUF1844 domain-containing protein [Candidatus Acidoferrales bacterium]
MADSKREETFKVIDRRHFTGEGDLRPEVVEMERREEEAAAKEAAAKKAATAANPAAKPPANSPNPTTKSGANPTSKNASAAAAASEYDISGAEQRSAAKDHSGSGLVTPGASGESLVSEAGEGATAEQTHSSRSFQMLVDFLTRNAAAMLGGMADPQTGRPFVDLEGAREVIDMLDALREKTRGNLSKEDDQLLIEVLGSLKLTFMEISKAAAEAMAKKAKAK